MSDKMSDTEKARKIIRQVLVDSDLITDPKLGAGDYYEAYTITTDKIIFALIPFELKPTTIQK